MSFQDAEANPLRDAELPDDSDLDEDVDDPTVTCPACRRSVHEDSDLCHHCGEFLQRGADDSAGRGFWLLAIVGLLLAMAYSWAQLF